MRGTQSNLTGVMIALALLPLVGACCSSGRASPPDTQNAPAESEVDRRVKELLSGYEHVPSAEDWARIGTPEEVSAALVRIAASPEGQTLTAARATSSLANFPRPEVARFLEQRIADPKAHPSLRGKAAIALAAGFGDAQAGAIAPLFASRDEALREDAIRAFKRLVSPAAERFLEARARLEPSERLRTVMGEARAAIAEAREARIKEGKLPDQIRDLPAIADPGPIR